MLPVTISWIIQNQPAAEKYRLNHGQINALVILNFRVWTICVLSCARAIAFTSPYPVFEKSQNKKEDKKEPLLIWIFFT